jgi:hypothetical protein
VSVLARALCAIVLVLGTSVPVVAVEYTLQTAHLLDDSLFFFVRGQIGRGEGELALPALERALDSGEIGSGALLYDREVLPAGAALARAFGAVPVRVTGQAGKDGQSHWQSIRWEGNPGERALWIVRPASSFRQRARHLALSGADGGLRFFVPYRVSFAPRPLRVVEFSLAYLRTGEDGRPLWEPSLAKAVDLSRGLAVMIGQNPTGGDWVYMLVEQAAQPTSFKAVVGWVRSQFEDLNTHGGRGGGIHTR